MSKTAEEKVGVFPFEGLSATATSVLTVRGGGSSEFVVFYHEGIESAQVHRVIELFLELGGGVEGLSEEKTRIGHHTQCQVRELKAVRFGP